MKVMAVEETLYLEPPEQISETDSGWGAEELSL